MGWVINVPYADKEKEKARYIRYYPTHKEKQKAWWRKNSERLNTERNKRYKCDTEYKERKLKSNKKSLIKSANMGKCPAMERFMEGTGVCLICGTPEFPVLQKHHITNNFVVGLCSNHHSYFGQTRQRVHRTFVAKQIEHSEFLWS